jgi:hypothetical protein
MITTKYIYEIERVSSGDRRIVNPQEIHNIKIIDSQWEDEIFYRKTVDAEFVFIGDDFNYIYQVYNETSKSKFDLFYLYIKGFCNNQYELIYTGKFVPANGIYDLDKCTYSFSVETVDDYTCFLQNIDNEINLFGISPENGYCTPINVCLGTQEFARKIITRQYTNCTNCEIENCASFSLLTEVWSGTYGNTEPDWIEDWCQTLYDKKITRYPNFNVPCIVIVEETYEWYRCIVEKDCVNGSCADLEGENLSIIHDSSGNPVPCNGIKCYYWQCVSNYFECYQHGRLLNDALTYIASSVQAPETTIVSRTPENYGAWVLPLAPCVNYRVQFDDNTSGLTTGYDPYFHWGLYSTTPVSQANSYWSAYKDGTANVKICFECLYGHRLEGMIVEIAIFPVIGNPATRFETLTIDFPFDTVETLHQDYCVVFPTFDIYNGESFTVNIRYGCVGYPQGSYTRPDTQNCGMKMTVEFTESVTEDTDKLINCGLEYSSIFFDKNPDISNSIYALTNGGLLNYVTGLPSRTKNIIYDHISNIELVNPTNPATQFNITIKDFFKLLKTLFNVYWSIKNGKLIVEHFSYYDKEFQGLELNNNFYKDQSGLSVFTTSAKSIPKKEKFVWGFNRTGAEYHACANDFYGVPIIYPEGTGSAPVEEYQAERTINDVVWIRKAWDDEAFTEDEGLCFMSTYPQFSSVNSVNYSYTIFQDAGAITGNYYINVAMGWANLMRDYHKHNRYLPFGLMNKIDTLFYAKRLKAQVDIIINLCCTTIDPDYLIRTKLTNKFLADTGEYIFGEVVSVTYELYKNIVSLKIKY